MFEPLPENDLHNCPVCNRQIINDSSQYAECFQLPDHEFSYSKNSNGFELIYNGSSLLYHPVYGYRIAINSLYFKDKAEPYKEIQIEPFLIKDYKKIIEKYKKLVAFL